MSLMALITIQTDLMIDVGIRYNLLSFLYHHVIHGLQRLVALKTFSGGNLSSGFRGVFTMASSTVISLRYVLIC